MWRNDIKWIYMFMFPLKNLARKGLTKPLNKTGNRPYNHQDHPNTCYHRPIACHCCWMSPRTWTRVYCVCDNTLHISAIIKTWWVKVRLTSMEMFRLHGKFSHQNIFWLRLGDDKHLEGGIKRERERAGVQGRGRERGRDTHTHTHIYIYIYYIYYII